MAFISVFDVLGPNMIGPSSSHTAGAEIIAYLAQKMIAPPLKRVDFTLYGSFAKPITATAPTVRWWRACWASARTTPACPTASRWPRRPA